MPILAIDKFGNYYESDPDSGDGDGCKGVVPSSRGGDVTIDGSIDRAENARQFQMRQAKAGFAAYDIADAKRDNDERRALALRRAKSAAENFELARPEKKATMLMAGLKQSAKLNSLVEAEHGLSGNGMTANGLYGRAGMSNQELGAQIALGLAPAAALNHSVDSKPITPVSRTEMNQYFLQQKVTSKLASDARTAAKLNAAQSSNEEPEFIDREAQGIQTYEAEVEDRAATNAAQKLEHPLMNFFRKA